MHLPGHLGVTLFLVAFVVLRLGERTGLAFAALAAPFSMLPDVDLVLPAVSHHGVTHTVGFVVGASLVIGTALTVAYRALDVEERWVRGEHGPQSVFGFATGAVLIASLGHVGLDLLSAPDVAQPLEPLWPLYGASVVSLDFLPVGSGLWNFGLLGFGGVVWILAYALAR